MAADALKNKPAAPKPRTGPATKAELRSVEAEVDSLMGNSPSEREFGQEEDEPRETRARKPKEEEAEDDEPPPAAAREAAEPEPQPASDEGTKKKPYTRDDFPETSGRGQG